MNYKLYRRKKKLKGKVKYSDKVPYEFNPSYHKSDEIIDISKLSLYNSWMTDNILSKKYVRRYKKLLKMVYLLFNDEIPSDSGTPAVLGEVDKIRATLNDKYMKYLSMEKVKLYLKELDYIENELKTRYLEKIIFKSPMLDERNFRR